MKTLYFDCFSGASGDMIVGALLDLGLPIDSLRAALGSLAVEYGGVSVDRVLRAGVSASKFRVHAEEASDARLRDDDGGTQPQEHPRPHNPGHDHKHSHDHGHTHDSDEDAHGHAHSHDHRHTHHHGDTLGSGSHHSLADIARYVGRSSLSPAGKDRAMHLFERLAEAEAAIHAVPIDQVHLHEVGAIDSIIDIVCAVHGLEWAGAARLVSSPLNVGSGTVQCAHGTFPVPAPATARLLVDVPVYAGDIKRELVTPTGALLVSAYASSYGPLPPMRIQGIGYGAGTRDFPSHPNVLRMFVGEAAGEEAAERILRIECEIDDMNPQLFGPLMDRLASAGALDVFYGPVQMKKNRPGTLVTVLAAPEHREAIVGMLFTDTTTIGVRYAEMLRDRLDREVRAVETAVGTIRFKLAGRGGRVLNAAPEFDDCARAAAAHGMPIKDVQAIATRAWLETQDRG